MNEVTVISDKECLLTVEDASLHLLFDEPFYGHLISGINKKISNSDKQKEVTQIHSLGATSVSINFDVPKWSKLKKSERAQRLKKEVLHYIFMHPWIEQPSNKGLFYASCVLSVSIYTKDKTSIKLDNFSSLSKKYKLDFVRDSWDTIYKCLVNLSGFIHLSATKEEAIEWTIKASKGEFMEGNQFTEALFYLPQGPNGSMNLSEVAEMVEDMKSGGATEEEISEAISKLAASGSDPWEGVKKGTSDLGIKSLISNALKDSKARGDVPGDLSTYIDSFLSPPKIDWKHELRRFESSMGNVTLKTTMSRKSKRFNTFPSSKIVRTQRIAIIADSSGSVSDQVFTKFFSEMNGILKSNCEVIFIQADADVDQVDIYTSKLPQDLRINRCGNGGTAFGPALNFVKSQGRENDKFPNIGKVDGVIYMTDGYAPAPDQSCYPMGKMLWITTDKLVERMVSEGFLGKIIFLDCDEDSN